MSVSTVVNAVRRVERSQTNNSTRQPRRFFDARLGVDVMKIMPGEFHATHEPVALLTVLGSCVAVCLHDPVTGIGGMNHFMLPDDGSPHGEWGSSGRYGLHAMELLIDALLNLGADRSRLKAKVFGGAGVLASLAGRRVGESNAAFIRKYLAANRIPITAADLEGLQPRKILFYPVEGRAMVQRLAAVDAVTEVAREQASLVQLVNPLAGGSRGARLRLAGDDR